MFALFFDWITKMGDFLSKIVLASPTVPFKLYFDKKVLAHIESCKTYTAKQSLFQAALFTLERRDARIGRKLACEPRGAGRVNNIRGF